MPQPPLLLCDPQIFPLAHLFIFQFDGALELLFADCVVHLPHDDLDPLLQARAFGRKHRRVQFDSCTRLVQHINRFVG